MKFRIHFSVGLLGCCAAALYCLNASAAQPPTKTPAPSAKPDAAPTEPEIPRSIFTIPKNSKEGRDPFFPASTYVGYSAPAARTNVSGPVTIPKMVLMGISGTREKPLAIINGRTFGRGE